VLRSCPGGEARMPRALRCCEGGGEGCIVADVRPKRGDTRALEEEVVGVF
jgi:hypothetical protein